MVMGASQPPFIFGCMAIAIEFSALKRPVLMAIVSDLELMRKPAT